MIAIVCAAVWLNGRMKRAAIEQELAQLNTPANLSEVPPQMISMDLLPITVRSLERGKEFRQSTDIRIVELHLPWIQRERYPTYQAEVRRVGGDESFTIPNLQAEDNGQYQIRVRLPARIFSRGQYQVRLSGIDPTGAVRITEEYAFTVAG